MKRLRLTMCLVALAVMLMSGCGDEYGDITSISLLPSSDEYTGSTVEISVDDLIENATTIDPETEVETETVVPEVSDVTKSETEQEPETAPVPETAPEQEPASNRTYYGSIVFDTTDINGVNISTESLKGNKLIMLNFWESWCGPCVREMPELELLYQNYKDQGFIILGAYSTEYDEDNVKAIIKKTGVTYPVLYATSQMYNFMTEYVPTTIFMDGEGNVLSEEPFIGSNDYSGWETIVKDYFD